MQQIKKKVRFLYGLPMYGYIEDRKWRWYDL